MGGIYASSGTVSYSFDGETWKDLGDFTWAELTENPPPAPPMPPDYDEWRKYITEHTFTIDVSFEPTPDFYGLLVGLQLQYELRELHRNLGRYMRWPYTN